MQRNRFWFPFFPRKFRFVPIYIMKGIISVAHSQLNKEAASKRSRFRAYRGYAMVARPRLLSTSNRPGTGLMVHDNQLNRAMKGSAGDIYGRRSPNEGELAGIGGFRLFVPFCRRARQHNL